MHLARSTWFVIASLTALACSSESQDPSGEGGSSGVAGSRANSGGTAASGSGGSQAGVHTGGATSSGGAFNSTGGVISSGGSSPGGSSSVNTGGSGGAKSSTGGSTIGSGGKGSGGSDSSGGKSSTGGAIGSGGKSGTGGTIGGGGKAGSGGTVASGGSVATGGSTSKGGAGGAPATGGASSGGKAGTGGSGTGGGSSSCAQWPAATGSQSVTATIKVSGTYDGQLKRFVGAGDLGTGSQDEDQPAMFQLAAGATLRNVIIGAPAADGVHCDGACTLENVWWEDVGEDAATFRGSSSSQRMTVNCGGAKKADDKVFQHNGAGTLTIQNFSVDTFGKLYRSCGNCSTQYARHVVMQDITARSGSALAGINTNYGDSAEFDRITIYGSISICDKYTGNSSGDEPSKTGSGSDSQYCLYSSSDITQR